MRQVIFYNLEAEIIRAGLKKSQVASMAGLSPSAFSERLKGGRQFKLEEMETIKNAVNPELTLEYLFKRDQ